MQQQEVSFTITQSGQSYLLVNPTTNNSTALSVSYTFSGAPASGGVSIEGINNSLGGTVAVLDTYASVSNTTGRSVNVTANYDSFKFTATWTGGLNVLVGVVVASIGPG